MKIIFTHPRDTSTFEAEITEGCSGQEAINGLVEAKFLKKSSSTLAYTLKAVSTGKAIGPAQTFADAQVRAGDTVAVLQTEPGATGEEV